MAIIIGAGTQVTGAVGVVSVSWDISPNLERLWELGEFDPYVTRTQVTKSINLTVYAGGMSPIDVSPPSTSCEINDSLINVTVIPAVCAGSADGAEGPFFLNSYSYSKGDPTAYAQESYSGNDWVATASFPYPNYVLRGISEGQFAGTLSQTEMGVTGGTPDADGSSGSVSAGFPGIGQADTTYYLSNIASVGGGVLGDTVGTGAGKYGNASVSLQHTPLWIS